MNNINALSVLDQLDAWRRKHRNDPTQNYDYAMRMACAIIAKEAGYNDRNEWTEALKADGDSAYAKDMKNPLILF